MRGLGTLVPEDTMLITARSDGRIERILIRPGTPVKADSVVMILSSPELENSLVAAEYALKAAEADYQNLKAAGLLAERPWWDALAPWLYRPNYSLNRFVAQTIRNVFGPPMFAGALRRGSAGGIEAKSTTRRV